MTYGDRLHLVLTRAHVEDAKRRGARIRVRDALTLVIEDVDPNDLDDVLLEVSDVLEVIAPKGLARVLDRKLRDVLTVTYVDPEELEERVKEGGLSVIERLAGLAVDLVNLVSMGEGLRRPRRVKVP